MHRSVEVGKDGEKRALEWYLKTRPQVKLLIQNYLCKGGEIDLILEESTQNSSAPELVFVEVRVRHEPGWVSGPLSVTPTKRQRLNRAAQRFLMTYRGPAKSMRFDLLYWNGQKWNHLENIWF